ncbi:MAG: hypothetical protein LBE12_14790, partial [Planctomycetaceae bacterium]|nr:hypothetical protein [Planctomycetaceae bacterium]
MKRMFIFSIVISFLLIIYSVVAAAPEIGTPYGKSFYSSRPNRGLRTFSQESPTLAPVTDQVLDPIPDQVQVSPNTKLRPAPLTPNKLLDNQTFSNRNPSDFSSTIPVLAPQNHADQPNQSILPTDEKIIEVRPLSKIDTNPSTAKAERTEVYKKTDESFGSNFISRTTSSNNQPPFIEEGKNIQEIQLDELNARLAKIQLEKHYLNETLKLIDKIKSPAIKARTLVDLAEYVSRDNNYKKEADQLFALAVDGIDALAKGEAIVIKIRDDLKTEPILKVDRKPDESLTETLSLTPDISASPVKPSSTPAVSSTTKRVPILIDDEPEQKPTLEEKLNVIPKEATSPSVPVKRPPILLGDEPETPKSETLKEEKPVEIKTPPTRKPQLLITEEPEINKEKETETKMTEPVKTET